MNQEPPCDGRDLGKPPVADEIDLICDAFEEAWILGETPPIEDFLNRGDESLRELLLTELLLVDREYRVKRGEGVDRQCYQQQFPGYSTVIEGLEFATIADRNDRRSSVNPISSVASPGSKIASFELLEELGSGASGTVWKASDARLRRIVAIKIPRQEILNDVLRERFLREGQACAQLRHPNIVAIHEVGEDRGRAFIVAEFVDGVNLREWLSLRRPKPRESAELVAQLAEALHHAHEQGVIHRDLKPANVILDRDDQPHITDFGLAKWAADPSEMTLQGELLGTPAYMSPEQARGDAGRVDCRTDVFALGVILYEMLTERRPFEGEHAALIDAIVRQEPSAPSVHRRSIPRDLDTICLKALEKDANRRYATAQEMAVDLQRFLRGEPIFARRAGPLNRMFRWVRRHPGAAVSVLLALAALGFLGMIGIYVKENRALLGLRTTTLATEPPGAKVIFVRISETTGEPLPSEVIRADGRSPIEQELRPGDYLVVTVLDDGRFHEVRRHVPSSQDGVPGRFHHLRWSLAADGRIVLPMVNIPPASAGSGMARVKVDSHEQNTTASNATSQTNHVRYLRVAPLEFTIGDLKAAYRRTRPDDIRTGDLPDNYAAAVDFDEATQLAEIIGMRLPSDSEYDAIARFRDGSSLLPVSNESVDSAGPVGTPAEDCIATSPPIFGICSNAAEWTSSLPSSFVAKQDHILDAVDHIQSRRIVRGGVPSGFHRGAAVRHSSNSGLSRLAVLRHEVIPGLGFRVVRSESPRFREGD